MKKNKSIILASLGLFLFAISTVIIYMWKNKFTISETGTLGDAFNGLLAPFISFAGALLVYFSFKEQLTANGLISKQWQFEKTLEILQDIKKSFLSIQTDLYFGAGTEIKKGAAALASLFSSPTVYEEDVVLKNFKKLEHIMIELQYLIKRFNTLDDEDKKYAWLKLDAFYAEELQVLLNNYIVRYNNDEYKYTKHSGFDLNNEIGKFTKDYNKRYQINGK